MAVINEPERAPNPLFLVGPVGSGKSHLLAMIEEGIGGKRVLRIAASEYVDKLLLAIREQRHHVEENDVLLLDDFGMAVRDKPFTERELVLQIEGVVKRGGQVVATSDRAASIGEAVTLGYPDDAARLEILRRLAESRRLTLSPRNLRELAGKTPASPRELQSIVARLAAEEMASPSKSPRRRGR